MYTAINPNPDGTQPAQAVPYTGRGWFRGQPLARPGVRILAMCIDYIPVYVGITLLQLYPWRWFEARTVPYVVPDALNEAAAWWLNIGQIVVFLIALYFIVLGPLFLAMYLRSDTELDADINRALGEEILGLTPVRPRLDPSTGEPFANRMTFWQLFGRWALHLHTLYLPFGIVRMFFSRAHQTFGDKWTGVVVLGKDADLSLVDCQERPSVRDRL